MDKVSNEDSFVRLNSEIDNKEAYEDQVFHDDHHENALDD